MRDQDVPISWRIMLAVLGSGFLIGMILIMGEITYCCVELSFESDGYVSFGDYGAILLTACSGVVLMFFFCCMWMWVVWGAEKK